MLSGTANVNCDAVERVQWDLAPLAAGDHITVSYPMGFVELRPTAGWLPLRAEVFEPLVGCNR